MKTISNNYSGTVVRTSNNGFSVKKTYDILHTFLNDNNIPFSVDFAKTGSIYIEFKYNNINYSVRISNHSRRTINDYKISEKIQVESYMAWVDACNKELGKEEVFTCDFEILNTETKKIFINSLNDNFLCKC